MRRPDFLVEEESPKKRNLTKEDGFFFKFPFSVLIFSDENNIS